MKKLTGTLKITLSQGSEGARPCFEVVFVPYVGHLPTLVRKVYSHEDLATLMLDLRLPEEDAVRWAGKARIEGVVLIAPFERTQDQLIEQGLLAR